MKTAPVNRSMNACCIKFRLITVISVFLAFAPQFALSPTLRADESPLAHLGDLSGRKMPSQMFWSNADRSANSSAVDANGVRHRGIDYGRKRPPWLQDGIQTVAPDYPDRDRILRHEGNGLFQLTLDLKTGLVTRVTVIKSTGFPTLDTAAVVALRQWRWKSGKWKEIEIELAFTHGVYRGTSRFPPTSLPFP
jgi:TonB family protein